MLKIMLIRSKNQLFFIAWYLYDKKNLNEQRNNNK